MEALVALKIVECRNIQEVGALDHANQSNQSCFRQIYINYQYYIGRNLEVGRFMGTRSIIFQIPDDEVTKIIVSTNSLYTSIVCLSYSGGAVAL